MKAVIVPIAQASANNFATWDRPDSSQEFRRQNERPRRSYECSHSSTFRRNRGPCSVRTGCCRHLTCTKTCVGAISAALTHRRSHHFRAIDLSQTFPLAPRPVNQGVTLFCSGRSTRSDDSTEPGWKVMLVAIEHRSGKSLPTT